MKLTNILMMSLVLLLCQSCLFAKPQNIRESDVIQIVERAGQLIEKEGDKAIPQINNPKGAFIKGDLYAFVYDENVVMIANPFMNNLVGTNLKGKPDITGKMFRDIIVEQALNTGEGWTTYVYKKPDQNGLFEKKTYGKLYMYRNKKYIVCSGMYIN